MPIAPSASATPVNQSSNVAAVRRDVPADWSAKRLQRHHVVHRHVAIDVVQRRARSSGVKSGPDPSCLTTMVENGDIAKTSLKLCLK